MSSFRTILVNAGWLVSDRLVRLILNFAVGILIARHLGPERFGLLSYGQVLMTLLLPFATFGMPDILVREFSKSKRDPETILATALGLRLGFACLAFLLIGGIALASRGGDDIAVLVILAYGLSFFPQMLDVVESRFQSLNRVGAISTIRMVNTVVFSLVRLGALFADLSVQWFALLYSIEILAFALLTLWVARRHDIRIRRTRWDRAEARALLTDSWPLMLRLLTISIYMRIDQLMIQRLMGDAELGVYSAAIRISELWYFIPTAIMTAAAPNLTRRYEAGVDDYHTDLRRFMRIMVGMSVAAALVLTFFSGFIVQLLFGPAYAAAAPVLAIQTWAGVFVAIGVASSPWFINTGMMRYGLYQAVAGAIASICLNSILIPAYGLTGAAVSLVLSYAISAVLLNACFHNTRVLFAMQMRAFVLR